MTTPTIGALQPPAHPLLRSTTGRDWCPPSRSAVAAGGQSFLFFSRQKTATALKSFEIGRFCRIAN